MNEQFTPELLAQARTAETPEALTAMAAEHGVPLTPEEAQAYFNQFHQTGELADEELDNVAGGKGCMNGGKMVVTVGTRCANRIENWMCVKCGKGAILEWDYDGSQHHQTEIHRCNGVGKSRTLDCGNCKHCTYERGLWLCNNPAAYC